MIYIDRKKERKIAIEPRTCIYCGLQHFNPMQCCQNCSLVLLSLDEMIKEAKEYERYRIYHILLEARTEIIKIGENHVEDL